MKLETLQKEMINAMKAKDKPRKETISALIGAIKKVAIDEKVRDNIPEELVDRVILKEKKTVQEMIDTCPIDRVDTLEEYRQRMYIIDEFAPKMMTEDETREFINNAITMIDVINKGNIMKHISPQLKGKADMKLVNQIVTEICNKVK